MNKRFSFFVLHDQGKLSRQRNLYLPESVNAVTMDELTEEERLQGHMALFSNVRAIFLTVSVHFILREGINDSCCHICFWYLYCKFISCCLCSSC